MRRIWTLALVLLCLNVSFATSAPAPPKIDKLDVAQYLRYAEGFADNVHIVVDDPSPSPFHGYYRLLVHLSAGDQKLDRVYYITADGKSVVNGSVWELGGNPFLDTLDTLRRLPAGAPSFGPADAKVTIVIFSDFECPFCRQLARTIRQNIPAKYPKDVRVVFADFPLDAIHKWAHAAAEAAHCLANQNTAAFWSFHDWVFEHQQEVNEANLREKILPLATTQKLDLAKLNSCIDSHTTAHQVDENTQIGRELQISRTPTLFVNGRMIAGAVPWETIDAAIKLELDRPKKILGPETSGKCCQVTIPEVGPK